MFDEIKDKAEGLKDKAEGFIADHKDQVEGVTDTVIGKVGDAADAVTGHKFSDHIDAAEKKADDAI